MYRRRLLAGVGTALATGGCLGVVRHGGGGQGTEGLPTRLWFERVSLSAAERDGIDPIVFADLPTAEREIVRTALDEGEYAVETGSESPAFERLADRIERRADGGLEVYLRKGEVSYRVGFARGDHVVAHPDQ